MTAPWEDIDVITRNRVGELAAHGFVDTQIADLLIVTLEQIVIIKESPEYKQSFAAVSERRAQNAIDTADGWDAVEEKALGSVISTLEYNRDPQYALMAARVANGAKRRTGGHSQQAPVIDAANGGQTIIINMNKNYVQANVEAGTLQVSTNTEAKQIPLKRNDCMAPGSVTSMLSPSKELTQTQKLELEVLGTQVAEIDIGELE